MSAFSALWSRVSGRILRARALFLFLDYDGTLRKIAGRPVNANPDPALLRLLHRLERAPAITCAIVTGRPISNIRRMLPLGRMWFVGTHGLEVGRGLGRRRTLLPVARARSAVGRIAGEIIRHIDSSFTLENKRVSLSLHYRLANRKAARRARGKFWELARPHIRSGALEMLPGKCVLELRPRGANKGLGVGYLLRRLGNGKLAVAIGDDRVDEDMFRAIKPRGVTIAVGRRKSEARYRLGGPAEVRQFLRRILKTFERKDAKVGGG